MRTIHIGLLGLGTVGSGVVTLLEEQAEIIIRRVGARIVVTAACVKDLTKTRACEIKQLNLTTDPQQIIHNPAIDIVVELIGGTTLARDLALETIAQHKSFITANKALIARYGNEILTAAQQQKISVLFEAAVAGGIPIIKVLREGLCANRIESIMGIINGTGNFILSEMFHKQRDFADVLREAQQLGYAEADPSLDIGGQDIADKLTILAALGFNIPLQRNKVYVEGIEFITALDIREAAELGYRIKHLGISRMTADGIQLRVHPTLIPEKQLLAHVDGVTNAVLVKGHATGPTLYQGAGAGSFPTASAVVADIMEMSRVICSKEKSSVVAFDPANARETPLVAQHEIISAYYLRFLIVNQATSLAEVTRILGENDIHIKILRQKNTEKTEPITIIIMTYKTLEKNIDNALSQLQENPCILSQIMRIRVEED